MPPPHTHTQALARKNLGGCEDTELNPEWQTIPTLAYARTHAPHARTQRRRGEILASGPPLCVTVRGGGGARASLRRGALWGGGGGGVGGGRLSAEGGGEEGDEAGVAEAVLELQHLCVCVCVCVCARARDSVCV